MTLNVRLKLLELVATLKRAAAGWRGGAGQTNLRGANPSHRHETPKHKYTRVEFQLNMKPESKFKTKIKARF